MSQEIIKHSDNEIKIINTKMTEEVMSLEQIEGRIESVDIQIEKLQEEKQKYQELKATAIQLGVSPLSE